MVDAAVARAFAEGRVPANITYLTPEYLSESRDPPAIVAIIVVLALATLFVALRCYSRICLVKSFGLDDSLALCSYVCLIAFVVLSIILIEQGSGRHIEYIQYVLTQAQTDSTEVNDFAAHLIYTSALFLCRLSGLAFFHRLCLRHQPLLRVIRAAAVFLVCAFLPQFFLILVHCRPVTGLWPYAWQPNADKYKCVTWGTVYVTNSGLSLVCDIIVFSIPMAMISLLKLSHGRKIMLAFVLMPGVVVIGISAARLYLCVVGQWASDGSWYYDPQLAIEVAEIGGTLMALSVPGLKPLFGLLYEKLRSTVNSSARRSSGPDPEQAGHEPKGSEVSRRMSNWMNNGNVKTSINGDSAIARDSSRRSSSDEELVGSRDIMVQMDVHQRSVPLRSVHPSSP